MRHALFVVLALALPVLAAAPAWAGEVCEGDGYKVRVPDGFSEALSMSGEGHMKVESKLGMLPIDGMPETTVYVAGDMHEPRGSFIVARVNIKSGHEIEDLDDLGISQLETMRSRMPEGFEMELRKVGKYDALEMKMSMEMMDEEMTMRMLSVAGGDFVMVLMLQTNDADFPAADTLWQTTVASLELSARSNKLVLYGGIGVGALVALVLLAKFAGGKGSGGYVEVNDWRKATGPSNRTPQPGARLASRPAPRPGAAPAAPASAPARPQVTPSGRPGLRPTLPPSGQWSDGTPR